jgi:PAS domain S-box-containing protein
MTGNTRKIVKHCRWIPTVLALSLSLLLLFLAQSGMGLQSDMLTPEERSWISEHPVIRIAPDPAYEPMEFFSEKGVYSGITADYLSLIQKRTGIRFQVVRLRNREEIFNAAQNRQIDVLGAVTKTPQRSKYLLFTRSYLEIPLVIIARTSPHVNLTPNQLVGKKVSVVTQHVSGDYLPLGFPRIAPDMVPDVRTGLRNVSFGVSDALLENLLIATFLMEKEGISNLRVAGELGFYYMPAIACRSDWPILNRILEKGLAGISPSEREIIYKKWVPFESQVMILTKTSRKNVLVILGFVVFLVAGIIVWNRSLTRQVDKKTAELKKELAKRGQVEEELLRARDELELRVEERTSELSKTLAALSESEERYRCIIDTANEGIWVLDREYRFTFANTRMADMLGYRVDELLGKTFASFLYEEGLAAHAREAEARRRGESSRYERRLRRKDGDTVWALVSVTPLMDSEFGFHGCFAMCVDITTQKRAVEALQTAHDELETRVSERTVQLTELTEELSRAEERERRRIATELHDQVGQMLALSKIHLNSFSQSLPPDKFARLLIDVREHINTSINEIRSLTFQLSPPLLYEVGLGAALEGLCEEIEDKYRIRATFRDTETFGDLGKPEHLPEGTRIALYQMARELMINVVKHARASRLLVDMKVDSGSIEIVVEDDGIGFDAPQSLYHANQNKSFGLFSIQHRISHLGGQLDIQSNIGHGSRVTLSAPLRQEAIQSL